MLSSYKFCCFLVGGQENKIFLASSNFDDNHGIWDMPSFISQKQEPGARMKHFLFEICVICLLVVNRCILDKSSAY